MTEKQILAYHEAGHAVAAYFMGLHFKSVAILGKDFTPGYIEMDDYDEADISVLREHCITIYAAWFAEELIDSTFDDKQRDAWWTDSMQLQKLIEKAELSQELQKAYKIERETEAKEFVHSPKWKTAIQAVADALLEQEVLDYTDVEYIIKHSGIENTL